MGGALKPGKGRWRAVQRGWWQGWEAEEEAWSPWDCYCCCCWCGRWRWWRWTQEGPGWTAAAPPGRSCGTGSPSLACRGCAVACGPGRSWESLCRSCPPEPVPWEVRTDAPQSQLTDSVKHLYRFNNQIINNNYYYCLEIVEKPCFSNYNTHNLTYYTLNSI